MSKTATTFTLAVRLAGLIQPMTASFKGTLAGAKRAATTTFRDADRSGELVIFDWTGSEVSSRLLKSRGWTDRDLPAPVRRPIVARAVLRLALATVSLVALAVPSRAELPKLPQIRMAKVQQVQEPQWQVQARELARSLRLVVRPTITAQPSAEASKLVHVAVTIPGQDGEPQTHVFALRRGQQPDVGLYIRREVMAAVQNLLGWRRLFLEVQPRQVDHVRGEHAFSVGGPEFRRAAVAVTFDHPEVREDMLAAGSSAPREAFKKLSPHYQQVLARCHAGHLPPRVDFSASVHARYRGRLTAAERAVQDGDVDQLRAMSSGLEPTTSSRLALKRYVDMAVIALLARDQLTRA